MRRKKETKPKMKKKVLIIVLIIAFVIVISVAFSLINIGNNKIYPNIEVQGVSVYGKEQEEANIELNKIYNEKKLTGIILKQGDYETTISFDQLGVSANIGNAVTEAYSIGRSGNIITNNYNILLRYFIPQNIEINFTIDENSIDKIIEDVESKLPNVVVDNDYYIDGDKLIITKGKAGVIINKDELKQTIIAEIKDFSDEDYTIEIPVIETSPEEINIEKIADEITCEPQNAYLSEEPLEVHAEQDGVSLAISIDEAKSILAEDKEEYEIPLTITEAEVKVTDLGEDAFPNLLGTCTTNYDASNINRNNNLVLAAEKLNGTIVNPGETFSYNQTIGQRTIAAGFKEAKAYANGKVVLDVGGGICQLSSTLYNSVLLSNLEVVERRSHYFKTSYLPAGRDATVSWGSVDFKFKNNRKYPIKIVATAQDGVVKVDIYGIKQDDDYDVTIESEETGVIPMETIYEEDNSLVEGQQVVTQRGEDGCTSETYKTLSRNGIVVSRTLVSKDTYNDLPTIIKQNSNE